MPSETRALRSAVCTLARSPSRRGVPHHTRLTDEKAEAQRGREACSGPRSHRPAEPGWEVRLQGPGARGLSCQPPCPGAGQEPPAGTCPVLLQGRPGTVPGPRPHHWKKRSVTKRRGSLCHGKSADLWAALLLQDLFAEPWTEGKAARDQWRVSGSSIMPLRLQGPSQTLASGPGDPQAPHQPRSKQLLLSHCPAL